VITSVCVGDETSVTYVKVKWLLKIETDDTIPSVFVLGVIVVDDPRFASNPNTRLYDVFDVRTFEFDVRGYEPWRMGM